MPSTSGRPFDLGSVVIRAVASLFHFMHAISYDAGLPEFGRKYDDGLELYRSVQNQDRYRGGAASTITFYSGFANSNCLYR
jgi:hypothetical protein